MSNQTTTSSAGQTAKSALESPSVQMVIRVISVLIGVTGLAANGVVIYAMRSPKVIQNKDTRIAIINQVLLYFMSSLLLIVKSVKDVILVTYKVERPNFAYCLLIEGEGLQWCCLNAAAAAQMATALERYLLIVRPQFQRAHWKRWMTYSTLVASWFVGIVFTVPATVVSTRVADGACRILQLWPHDYDPLVYGLLYFNINFVLSMIGFVYFYTSIILTIQRQMNALAAHGMSVDSQARNLRSQANTTKTLMFVVVCYFVCWTPNRLFFLVSVVRGNHVITDARQITVVIAFLDTSISPFIHILRFQGFRTKLRSRMTCWRKKSRIDVTPTQEVPATSQHHLTT